MRFSRRSGRSSTSCANRSGSAAWVLKSRWASCCTARPALAIIFIDELDELDAIGRARGGGVSLGGHDEREQTLNQVLTQMDGFMGNEGVVVLAATNRPEILAPALLRLGRFDRRVAVNPPDQVGREQILRVHTRSVALEASVDLATVASVTVGMVGTDLGNLVNEAALVAAKDRRTHVAADDFSAALDKVVLGTARRLLRSPEERRRTAHHEAGHALVGMLTAGADPVRKISIIPRGQALGVTLQAPQTDRYGYTASYLQGRIVGVLAGRAAEQVVFGDVTTGAESDLEVATATARQMVGRWGMSEAIGPVSVLTGPGRDEGIFSTSAQLSRPRPGRLRGAPDPGVLLRRGPRHLSAPPQPARPAGRAAAGAGDPGRGRGLPGGGAPVPEPAPDPLKVTVTGGRRRSRLACAESLRCTRSFRIVLSTTALSHVMPGGSGGKRGVGLPAPDVRGRA